MWHPIQPPQWIPDDGPTKGSIVEIILALTSTFTAVYNLWEQQEVLNAPHDFESHRATY